MYRRNLLRTSAILALVPLVGCATGSTVTPSTVASDVATLAAAATAVVAGLPPGTNIPASLANDLAIVQQAANDVAGAGIKTPTTFAQGVNDFLAVASPLLALIPGIGPGVGLALGAIKVLWPVISTELGLVSAMPATKAVSALPAVSLADARARSWQNAR